MTSVIKKNGSVQKFNKEKLLKSVEHAMACNGSPKNNIKVITSRIAEDVDNWIRNKPEVTSLSIRKFISGRLSKYDNASGFLYDRLESIW